MSVRRSAPGATPTGSGDPTSVTSISGHGRGLRWQKSRKSYAWSFGSTARLACTKFCPSPAVMPLSLPLRMSARISRGCRVSIGMGRFYYQLRSQCQRRHATLIGAALLALAQARPHVRIDEDVRTLAAEHAQHLADDLDTHLAIGLVGHTGHVTRHDDVGEIQDRVVERRRLLLEYVDAGGTELATRERFEHGALVLHAPARGVDVDGAVLHEPER